MGEGIPTKQPGKQAVGIGGLIVIVAVIGFGLAFATNGEPTESEYHFNAETIKWDQLNEEDATSVFVKSRNKMLEFKDGAVERAEKALEKAGEHTEDAKYYNELLDGTQSEPKSDTQGSAKQQPEPQSNPGQVSSARLKYGEISTYGWGEIPAGKHTACGQVFNENKVTTALPAICTDKSLCGTEVKISYEDNTITAIANDCGPADWTGRVADLSQGAWKKLTGLNNYGVINGTISY